MSNGLANIMSNSTGGVSRLWCAKCQGETLHRHGKCSCGAVHQAYPVRTVANVHIGFAPRSQPKRRGKRWNGTVKP